MHNRPLRSPTLVQASDRISDAAQVPSYAKDGRPRSSGQIDAGWHASVPYQSDSYHSAKPALPSFRSRSMPVQITWATWHSYATSYRQFQASSSLCPYCRVFVLFPFKSSFFPRIHISNQQDHNKDEHFDEAKPAQLTEDDCPRQEKDHLDIEENE